MTRSLVGDLEMTRKWLITANSPMMHALQSTFIHTAVHGACHTPPTPSPPNCSFKYDKLIWTSYYRVLKKRKKNIAAQMSRFSGPGMVSLLSPPEKLLASSECEMPLLPLVTLRESDSSRSSKLLKMTPILPSGDMTAANEKCPLTWSDLNISQRHISEAKHALWSRWVWLGSVQLSCPLSHTDPNVTTSFVPNLPPNAYQIELFT